jgi:hypothetical protein
VLETLQLIVMMSDAIPDPTALAAVVAFLVFWLARLVSTIYSSLAD